MEICSHDCYIWTPVRLINSDMSLIASADTICNVMQNTQCTNEWGQYEIQNSLNLQTTYRARQNVPDGRVVKTTAPRGHKMTCSCDQEVIDLNPSWVKLGVCSTSV